MIDELDLGFDDYERGRSRHRRGRGGRPKQRKGKRKGRTFVALFMTLILLGALVVAGWFGVGTVRQYFTAKDYKGAGTGQVNIQVVNGDSLTDIANKLYAAQVVRSSKAFINATNANSKSRGIEVGYYRLHLHMKASLALDMLLARKADGALANKVSTRVTIPEGAITLDIYNTLSKTTHIPVADFQNAAKDPVALGIPSWWFKRSDGKAAPNPPSLEGFLFPATYDFDPGADAKSILSTMVKKFLDVTTSINFVDTVQGPTLNLTPYEALVAASIAQVEALVPDMPNVVRVLYNRAYSGKFPCSCLQLDSEVNYWLRISGQKPLASGQLRVSQLHNPKDPYNTHDKAGLPIGPISNPGKEALQAAMAPPKNGNLFFLAIDKAGHAAFATNTTQFCQLVNQAIANGVSASRC